jgi:hypothetical protein
VESRQLWRRRNSNAMYEVVGYHERARCTVLVGVLTNHRKITHTDKPIAAAVFTAAILTLVALVLFPAELAAQGQPFQNGPMIPLALWWAGAAVLGLVHAYGIWRKRRRTRFEGNRPQRTCTLKKNVPRSVLVLTSGPPL